MDPQRPAVTHGPFPVAPDDVPVAAVRALKRTMIRHGQPVDDDLARLLVAMVIAPLGPRAASPGEPQAGLGVEVRPGR
jgi:hypothetical protein